MSVSTVKKGTSVELRLCVHLISRLEGATPERQALVDHLLKDLARVSTSMEEGVPVLQSANLVFADGSLVSLACEHDQDGAVVSQHIEHVPG